MIRVSDISYSYGKRKIIDRLSFEASAGECTVFAGPNGSGKTTALSVIAGIRRSSRGTVSVDGRIGYVPQGTALIEDATVGENLRFFADLSSSPIPSPLPFSVGDYLDRRVSRLSGGMKKQVSIACAMAGDPNVILLDEPCAALDIDFRDDMAALIEKWKCEGRSVIYVCHDPAEFFPLWDRIVFFDSPAEIYVRGELPEDEASFVSFFKERHRKIKRK